MASATMPRRRTYGFSFSWRRASGLSATKGRLSRVLGVPLTRSGCQRKLGRLLTGGGQRRASTTGCLVPLVIGLLGAWAAGMGFYYLCVRAVP